MCFDKGKQVVSHTLTQRAAWEWMTDKCSRDSQHVYNYMFWYKHFVAFWDLLARFGAWWVFNNGTCLHGNNHILYHNQIIEIKIELNQKIVCFFFFSNPVTLTPNHSTHWENNHLNNWQFPEVFAAALMSAMCFRGLGVTMIRDNLRAFILLYHKAIKGKFFQTLPLQFLF